MHIFNMGTSIRLRLLLFSLFSVYRYTFAQQQPSEQEGFDTNVRDWITNPGIAGDGLGDYSIVVTEAQRQNNQTLLWGPYRPQVYFGIKPRLPDSFIGGLMWSGMNDFSGMQDNFRHTCEQHDNLDSYGWEEYDARTGGTQVVRDKGNQIDLEMEWRKVEGGSHGMKS